LTKTDDILFDLNRSVSDYIGSVHPFHYKNKTFRLMDNYAASPYMKCDVCGSYPTFEVSVIENNNGKTLRVGNDCIDSLTKQNVAEWFRSFRRKRENVIANRKYIDPLQLILDAQDKKGSSVQVTDVDAENLKVMLEQMCNGQNPTSRQEQLAECYLTVKATA
jgi:hypothetical protein